MKFRMKWKYYSGFNKERKTYHPDFPVLPGCFKPEERLKLNSIAKTISREEVSIRAREMLKGCPSKAPVFLEMKLRHGDFMSMHGAQMQVYYEVSVYFLCLIFVKLTFSSMRFSLITSYGSD